MKEKYERGHLFCTANPPESPTHKKEEGLIPCCYLVDSSRVVLDRSTFLPRGGKKRKKMQKDKRDGESGKRAKPWTQHGLQDSCRLRNWANKVL